MQDTICFFNNININFDKIKEQTTNELDTLYEIKDEIEREGLVDKRNQIINDQELLKAIENSRCLGKIERYIVNIIDIQISFEKAKSCVYSSDTVDEFCDGFNEFVARCIKFGNIFG